MSAADMLVSIDALFASRQWSRLELAGRGAELAGWPPADLGLVRIARLAMCAVAHETDTPRPAALNLLRTLTDAAWLLVNFRHEIGRLRRGWEPAGHYAVQLAHRAVDVLLRGYFHVQLSELWEVVARVDLHGDCKRLFPGREHVYLWDYLDSLERMLARRRKGQQLSAGFGALLDELGAEGIAAWKFLNDRRNDGTMGHGSASLARLAGAWRRSAHHDAAVVDAPDRPEPLDGFVDPVSADGSDGTLQKPSEGTGDTSDSSRDEIGVAGRKGRQAVRRGAGESDTLPQPAQDETWHRAADALDDYLRSAVRITRCCADPANYDRFDVPDSRVLIEGIEWDRLSYMGDVRTQEA